MIYSVVGHCEQMDILEYQGVCVCTQEYTLQLYEMCFVLSSALIHVVLM